MKIQRFIVLLLFFIIFQSLDGFGQSRFTKQLRSSYILNGLFDADPDKKRSFIKANFVLPGFSFSLGSEFGYFLNKKRTIKWNVSTLFEYQSFGRITSSHNSNNGSISIREQRFQSTYFTLPVEIECQTGKWSFTGGVVNTINFWTRYGFGESYKPKDGSFEFRKNILFTNFIGDGYIGSNIPAEEIYSDRWFNIQYSLGVRLALTSRISIGWEYRDFIFENILHHDYFDYDVFARQRYRQQTNALHFNFFYKMN